MLIDIYLYCVSVWDGFSFPFKKALKKQGFLYTQQTWAPLDPDFLFFALGYFNFSI